MRSLWCLACLVFARHTAGASNTLSPPESATSQSPPTPQSTACGDIVNDQLEASLFDASLVYECLNSVPFVPAVATRLVNYLYESLQFQSTLKYLRDPPESYRQPPADLLYGLDQIQKAIDELAFHNQYQFEVRLQNLLVSAHDSHLYLDAGILSAFAFGSPVDIVSLSIDGLERPKVYLAEDVLKSNSSTEFRPSPIKWINGSDAIEYLEGFAATNSQGAIEPHADWNQLMLSPAQDIQGLTSVFSAGARFYPGDWVTFTFENGSDRTEQFHGIYFSPGDTGPLNTGGDFFNFFVLGYYPASYNASSLTAAPSPTSSTNASQSSSISPIGAYPTPDILQNASDAVYNGAGSGYFLNSSSLAVLSLPSFEQYGDDMDSFLEMVEEFILKSRDRGTQRVVIDLQQNTGGEVLVAFEAFKLFFPNIEPFGGSRMRAHADADILGNVITDYFNGLDKSSEEFQAITSFEWAATGRIDADTNATFTTWKEFFGPHTHDGDNFTTVQRYDLARTEQDIAATGGDTNFTDSNLIINGGKPVYAADNIIILTDGICGSSCSLFVEMMHHQAGVRVVAAGGRPETVPSPMQGAGFGRGARLYPLEVLDSRIQWVQSRLSTQANRTYEGDIAAFMAMNRSADYLGVYINHAAVNLRDQVRRGDEDNGRLPLQFIYEPAECRIYFTPQTVFNYTALWLYAADAIWTNNTLCVAGSHSPHVTPSDGSVTTPSTSVPQGSSSQSTSPVQFTNHSAASLHHGSAPLAPPDPLVGDARLRNRNTYPRCGPGRTCQSRSDVCAEVQLCRDRKVEERCVPLCTRGRGRCPGGVCQAREAGQEVVIGSSRLFNGYCRITPAMCNNNGERISPGDALDNGGQGI